MNPAVSVWRRMKKERMKMRRDHIGKVCPYCKTAFTEADQVAFCGVCDMPHHLSCWQANQGCTTFGCTGTIKELVGVDMPAPAPVAAPVTPVAAPAPVTAPVTPVAAPVPVSVPAPVAAPVQNTQKPIEVIFESKETVFQTDVPLALENTALIMDRTRDKLFARCTFRCLTDRPIRAILVDITCQDVWGSPLGEAVEHQYLDLRTKREAQFGQNSPIELPDKATRHVQVAVKKILYADNTMVECAAGTTVMPAPVLLSQQLGSSELAAEYARKTTDKAQYVPVSAGGYWRCTCGALNGAEEEKCNQCASTLAYLTETLNPEELNAKMVAFQTERREAEEKARAEQEERIRRAEEEVQKEQQKRQEWLEFQEKEKKDKKKRKTAVLVICISAVLLVAAVLGYVFYGIPLTDYQAACKLLELGEYDMAHEMFLELGNFKDSAAMANEALYQKAEALLEDGQFTAAINQFRYLGDYKDSKDRVKEGQYRYAENCRKNGDYSSAYMNFMKLGDYSDSEEQAATTLVAWVNAALDSPYHTVAEGMKNVIELPSSQYQVFYNALHSHIVSHTAGEDWYNDGIQKQRSSNMYLLLQMLPSNYQNVGNLQKLFGVLEDSWNYEMIFRDNKALIEKCWNYEFVRNMAQSDGAITYFLEGYWSTDIYYTDYYFSFYESDSGGTSCKFNLPSATKPTGTKYYDVNDLIFVWEDANGNILAKVFIFEIVGHDTIKVYCYKDNRTYTLYR